MDIFGDFQFFAIISNNAMIPHTHLSLCNWAEDFPEHRPTTGTTPTQVPVIRFYDVITHSGSTNPPTA